jgi:addiction module RelE/StbE family toxin
MRLVWSEKAEKQLDQIFAYIAEDSNIYAFHTVEQIIKTAEGLLRHPRSGRVVPEYERADVREILYNPYRIIYRLSENQVEILSVIHARRLLTDNPE